MANHLNPVRTLLGDMAQDDYVRFKYGKRVDAALKLLEQEAGGANPAELEARLLELLELVRGKKGAGASAPGGKSRKRAPKAEAGAPVRA